MLRIEDTFIRIRASYKNKGNICIVQKVYCNKGNNLVTKSTTTCYLQKIKQGRKLSCIDKTVT